MWQEERHQKIRAQLTAFGLVSIDRIVDDFGVSRETARHDLMEMEQAGELRRVRMTQRLQEKRAIAATALGLRRRCRD